MDELTYEVYNKKSLAVRSTDRKKHQSIIKNLGGRWNTRMRGGEGWLLPIEKQEQLQGYIDSLKVDNEMETISKHIKTRKGQKKYHRSMSENDDTDSVNEDVKEDANKGVQEDANKGVKEDANKGVKEDANKGVKEDANKGVIKDTTKDTDKQPKEKVNSQYSEYSDSTYITPLVDKLLKKQQNESKVSVKRDVRNKKHSSKQRTNTNDVNKTIKQYKKFTKQSYVDDLPSSSNYTSETSTDDEFSSPEMSKRSTMKGENYEKLFRKVRDIQRRVYEIEEHNRSKKPYKSTHKHYSENGV